MPAGWAAVWSRACEAFYFVHNATGDRTWYLPSSDQVQPRPLAEQPPSPKVPSSWQAIWSDAHQGYYYWHHASGNATWEVPEPDDQTTDSAYWPGEKAMVRIQDGMAQGLWVPCIVSGEGLKADSYDIHVPNLPPGRQEVFDVHIRALRKVRPGQNASAPTNDTEAEAREAAWAYQDYNAVPVRQPGAWMRPLAIPKKQPSHDPAAIQWLLEALRLWHASRAPEPYKPGFFEPLVGEIMDVQVLSGPNKGSWLPCRVTGPGGVGGTYNIKMPVSGPVLAYIRDVPLWWLRKSTSPEAMIFRHYKWQQRVERLRR